jgi:hypothetical protein
MIKEITNYNPREQEGDENKGMEKLRKKVVTSLTPLT